MGKVKNDLPTYLYVVRDGDGDDSWFNANEDFEGFDDGATVAVYQRQELRTKRVKHELSTPTNS